MRNGALTIFGSLQCLHSVNFSQTFALRHFNHRQPAKEPKCHERFNRYNHYGSADNEPLARRDSPSGRCLWERSLHGPSQRRVGVVAETVASSIPRRIAGHGQVNSPRFDEGQRKVADTQGSIDRVAEPGRQAAATYRTIELAGLDACRAANIVGVDTTRGLGHRFLAIASQFPNQPAIVTATRSYAYGVVASATCKVASSLLGRQDFEPGDRVVLVAGNSPEYVAAFYGVLLAGGIVVPLPETIDSAELRNVVAHSEARLLVTGPPVLRQSSVAADATIETLDLARQSHPHAAAWGTGSEKSQNPLQRAAAILYTSGSTAKPKGVLLSHRNLLSNAESILDFLPIRQSDRILASVPLCHAYGNSVLQTHMLAGAALILDGSTTFPNSLVDALEQHQATSFAGVPEIYHTLLACSDLRGRSLPDLRYMTVAGAALEPRVAIDLADLISPARLYLMYGQTEATARLAYLSSDQLRIRPTSIGKAIPHVELAVRDRRGRPVAVGSVGELCARGPNVMLRYWRDPAATSRVIVDGWLHTGDLATVDGDGFVHLAGRRQDRVKIRGLNVMPREVAQALSQHLPPCQLVVVPFAFKGTTRLALFVAMDNTDTTSLQELRRVCRERLARHQLPSHIEMIDKIPRTASLKIDRRSLADRATQQINMRFTPDTAVTTVIR